MNQYEFNKEVAYALQGICLELRRLYDKEKGPYNLADLSIQVGRLVNLRPEDRTPDA